MDIQNYSARKTAGTETLTYIDGNQFLNIIKNFIVDPITGLSTQTDSTETTESLTDLQAQVAQHQAIIDQLNTIIADVQALTSQQ